MRMKFCFFMLVGGIIMAGCNQPDNTPVNHDVEVKEPSIMAPFKFHKLIEVSPGQYYDILSWGRGAAHTGSFIILHSDSSNTKYTTTTGDLNGDIVDVYNSDMDVDGNPEILIQAKGKDSTNYTDIYAFEFNDNKAQKLNFPKLTASQKKGYRGQDIFYIEEGKFIREFPIYNGGGQDAKPTGQKRRLQYGLSDNSFTVKQLSKDSTYKSSDAVKTTAPVPVKKDQPNKKQEKTKRSAKHHHNTEHHKRRHKRRHHNDEE
jgi:hypothetical protein